MKGIAMMSGSTMGWTREHKIVEFAAKIQISQRNRCFFSASVSVPINDQNSPACTGGSNCAVPAATSYLRERGQKHPT